MNREEYLHLRAERGTLENILSGIPEADVLDRRSFLARLEEVSQQIAGADLVPSPASARLTFRGRPVVGTYGIFAEFGMAATKAFADAVSAMAAALSSPLSPTGPIPNRQQNQLLITSTALGSFGFELEEHVEGKLLMEEERPVALALAQTQELLRGTLGTDDELADAATGADPRALAALRTFLETLATNEAVCAVQVGERRVAFQDVAEVRRSWERLGQDNLREERQVLDGEFQGVLPKRRTFEFKVQDSGEVITGKIGPAIADADELNRHLHSPARIEANATRIGKGRPRYVLNHQPSWTKSESVAADDPLLNLDPQTTDLDLSGTGVSDVSPLAALTKLRYLNLRGTKVSDVTPLAALTNLQILTLGGTQVSDLSPLAKMTNLRNLYLSASMRGKVRGVELLGDKLHWI